MIPITALLIEADPASARQIREILAANQAPPFSLKRASTLAAGLDILATQSVHAVVLDLGLPDCPGLPALDRILAAAPDTPVIALTGPDDDALGGEALARGAHEYMCKNHVNRHRFPRMIAYSVDHRRTMLALRESEERYRRLADNALDIIYRYRLHPTPGYEYINPAVTRITGYTPEEHYANLDLTFEIVHPDDRPRLEQLAEGRGLGEDLEIRWIRKDGQVIWTEQHNRPVYGPDGTLIAIEGIARDISDKKQAALALQEKEHKLRGILENSKDGIVLTDEEGCVIEWNPAQEQIAGLRREDVTGQAFWDVQLLLARPEHRNDTFRQRLESSIRPLLATGHVEDPERLVERELHRPDGTRVVVQYSTFVVPTPRGHMIGAIVRDITASKQAANELVESQLTLQGTLDAMKVQIAILDDTGTIVATNDTWHEYAENYYPEIVETPVGINYLDFCAAGKGAMGDAAPAVAGAMREILAGERDHFYMEYKSSHPGEDRWYIVTLEHFEHKNARRIVVGHVDITERVLAELARQEQAEMASALRETNAILSTELDLETVLNKLLEHAGKVVPNNTAHIMLIEDDRIRAVRWHGYTPEAEELFRNYTFSLRDSAIHRTMYTSHQPMVIPDTYASPDWIRVPETEWIRSYAATPILSHGQVIGFLELDSSQAGFFTQEHVERLKIFASQAAIAIQNAQLYDAVRNYALEQETRVIERTAALNRSIERIETILNSSSDAITVIRGGDGRIDQTNPAFDAMFGYEIMDIIRQPLSLLVAPTSQTALDEAMQGVLDLRQAQRVEIVAQRKDGTRFNAELALSPVVVDDQIANIVCSLRDISQHKQLEDSLRAALAQEKELSELKTRFTSMISHEFRTPLATILSSSGLLQEYSDRMSDERRHDHLAKIQAQVQYMNGLLDNILMIGKMETVGLDFNPAPLNLLALCEDVFQGIQLSADSRIAFQFVASGDEYDVIMDEKLIRHILVNLLSNAVKYSPNGGTVTLDLHCAGGEAIIRVSDQGVGIPHNEQNRIFQPFHRAPNVSTIKGTGLGLAIVKNAVELHGGAIDVASEAGAGATFTVSLPTGGQR